MAAPLHLRGAIILSGVMAFLGTGIGIGVGNLLFDKSTERARLQGRLDELEPLKAAFLESREQRDQKDKEIAAREKTKEQELQTLRQELQKAKEAAARTATAGPMTINPVIPVVPSTTVPLPPPKSLTDQEQAVQLIRQALEAKGSNPTPADLKKARDLLDQAIKKDPRSLRAYLERGVIRLAQNDAGASDDFNKVRELEGR
jgi:tetratricopeptide (TPR) repeat protein